MKSWRSCSGKFAIRTISPASSLLPAMIVSLLALFGCGALVSRVTVRSWWYGGLRQLVLGGAAAGLTYLIGNAVGASVG